jgi:hypothetical protein
MHRFTDNDSRTWVISVTVDAIKRVRALCDVDLLEAIDGKLLERLVSDPITLCDCIYALCKPQADEQGISDEAFGRAMAGDCLEQATESLLEDLVDFFPQRRRELLRGALTKLKEVEARAMDLAEQRLLGPELDDQVDALLAQLAPAPGPSSGTAPASSDATPDP